MSIVKNPVALVCTLLWIGFVSAISFMEAWLKFQAPGITLPLGLGIGRLVFGALNKVEWVFAVTILCHLLLRFKTFKTNQHIVYEVSLIVLILQTIWLLPALDARADLYINHQTVPSSNLHFYFIVAEGLKVIALSIFSIRLFSPSETNT